MLSFLGFAMVATFITLIMTRRVSALAALILVPVVFGVLGGFGASLGTMMLDGIQALAPTGVMLLFAILYFGLMIDVGLFDPLIVRIVKVVRGDPMRIVLGTAVLALIVSLDGDGATSPTWRSSPTARSLRFGTVSARSTIWVEAMAAAMLPCRRKHCGMRC